MQEERKKKMKNADNGIQRRTGYLFQLGDSFFGHFLFVFLNL